MNQKEVARQSRLEKVFLKGKGQVWPWFHYARISGWQGRVVREKVSPTIKRFLGKAQLVCILS